MPAIDTEAEQATTPGFAPTRPGARPEAPAGCADAPQAEAETLAEFLAAEEMDALAADAPRPNDGSAAGEPFCPTDAAGVDWVLGRMAAARAEAGLIRENAERMARACERRAEALEWKYGQALETWARAETADGKRKSVRLFHGVVGFRTKPGGVEVIDPAAALAWARQNAPAAVTERLDKRALGDALGATGEVVDFAAFLPAEEVFYMK